MRRYLFRVVYASLIVLAVFAVGCATNHSNTFTTSNVSVTVAPKSATVGFNQTQQFTATVNDNSNTAVNWEVNGTPGGSAAFGTIDNTGLYTAPASAPNARGTVVVEAVSQADPTKMDAATVGIGLSVTINPPSPVVQTGTGQQFSATVSGPANGGVAWSVNGVNGGNSVVGMLSTYGLYAAPGAVPSPNHVTVTATSVAEASESASAEVTITPLA